MNTEKVELVKNSEGRLILRGFDGLELCIDFDLSIEYRRRTPSFAKDLLGKALGFAKGNRQVLDLTAGMAIDAVFMAQNKMHVVALERSPLLFALLIDAHERITREDLDMSFMHIEAFEYLQKMDWQPDVIYYDPMYPAKKKTALPGKNMQVFQQIFQKDEASLEVLELAKQRALDRVVVKRPLWADPIAKPKVQFSGKTVRYDVY